MNGLPEILLSEIQYSLPDERIARYPLKNRDDSSLLISTQGTFQKDVFSSVSKHLQPESLMVFNNTRVIQARFLFHKDTGAAIEIFCLEPYEPSDYGLSLNSTDVCAWKCLVGNSKKWKSGTLEMRVDFQGKELKVCATRETSDIIKFEWNLSISFASVLETCGKIPVPPYLNRNAEELDKTRYQTVFSRINGSVAAPTAGLHFTPQLMSQLKEQKHQFAELTLHVGAGTFKPVKSEYVTAHAMHPEFFIIQKETLETMQKQQGNIVPVGTTSVRTLESLTFLAYLVENNLYSAHQPNIIGQWDIYNITQKTRQEVLNILLEYLKKEQTDHLHGVTSLMIIPGFRFLFTDQLITNFHQPGSTLLLLVSAFMGNSWKNMYNFALDNDFRFLSYGDACLITP